jgi:hypothetical protein
MSAAVRRLGEKIAIAAAALALAAGPVRAQQVPPDPAAYTFLATVADRGTNCGLLKAWQVAAILSQASRLLLTFAEADQADLIAAATEQANATPCDDPQVNQWIAAALPGIEREWLPPNLALFRSLATMDEPPQIFIDITTDTDLTAIVAAIDAKIADFDAAGVQAEGGMAWDDYLAAVDDAAVDIVAAVAGDPNAPYTQDEATGYVVDAAVIVTLWFEDQG